MVTLYKYIRMCGSWRLIFYFLTSSILTNFGADQPNQATFKALQPIEISKM